MHDQVCFGFISRRVWPSHPCVLLLPWSYGSTINSRPGHFIGKANRGKNGLTDLHITGT